MHELEPPDTHYLSAAIGWIGLGNFTEAAAELDGIRSPCRNHPDVLEARWIIAAEQKQWAAALDIARWLIQVAPQRSSGWLHQAYALRRVPGGGLRQAWDALLPVFDRFPKESTIPYNLSCYACQMQELDTARVWLGRAVSLAGKDHIKQMALADEDLEALWDEIRSL